ncbi:MAG: cell envelope integrity protein CreD [Reinekea sp.]
MKSRLGIKFITLIVVLLLLQVPLTLIRGQVKERNYTRMEVVNEISQSWGADQNVVGPIVMVPYTTTEVEKVWDENLKAYQIKRKLLHHHLLVSPDISRIDGNIEVTERKRSIYTAPVYNAELHLHGQFDLSGLSHLEGTLGTPVLMVLMSDLSGVLSIPTMKQGDNELIFEEGGYRDIKGIKTELANWQEKQEYDIQLALKGSQQISVYPLAKNNEVNLHSNWLHPSFNGQFLPETHRIADDGFYAKWRTTSLSSNAAMLLENCKQGNCNELMYSSFGVRFFEPVNHYTKSDRATKYAILLIVTTFAIFFVMEAMKSAAVHPVQYLLVGLSLTIFNLLLIALTEHLSFLTSYLISSVACLGLLGTYAQHILKRTSWLAGFMAILILIYTLMYFILLSEDYAFLMGSGFLFLILATLMLTTRKVNWHELMTYSSKAGKSDISV